MKELTIEDLFNIFMDNIKLIITTIIIGVIISIIYTTLILTPMYESSTKIILVKPSGNIDQLQNSQSMSTGLTVNDIMFNQKLVSTYSEIIKSRKVLEEVIDKLKLNASSEKLAKNITVQPVKDSEVINIAVVHENPEKAAAIANGIIDSFATQVNEIYKIENVNQVDKAIASNKPYNVSLPKNILLFAIVAFMLSFGTCFLFEYFRTTINSPEDIEAIDGLSILAIIPDINREGLN